MNLPFAILTAAVLSACSPVPIDWRCDDTRHLDVPRADRGCDHGRDRVAPPKVTPPEKPTEPPAKPEEPEKPTEPQKPGFEPSREQDPEGHKAWKDAVHEWERQTGKDWTPPERVSL